MRKYEPLTMLDAIIGIPIVGLIIALALMVDLATGTKHLNELRRNSL